MTPTSTSSSILLSNPAASSGKSAVASDAQAAAGAGSGGFELLLGAVRQMLSATATDADGKADAAVTDATQGGKALPPTGMTLPLPAVESVPGHVQLIARNPVSLEDTAKPGKQSDDTVVSADEISAAIGTEVVDSAVTADSEVNAKASDGKPLQSRKAKEPKADLDEASNVAPAAAVLTPAELSPQPAVGGGSRSGGDAARAAADSAVAVSISLAPKKGADTTRDKGADADKVGSAARTAVDPLVKAVAIDSDRAVAGSAAPDATTTDANAMDASAAGSAKRESQSDFDALVKHFEAPAARSQPSVATVSADSSNVQQASRSYVSVAHETAVVSTPVGNSGWSDAIADKVMWFSANKISSAEIHLNPPDLGPLQVRVSTQHDQASIAFTSQHAAVRDALDQALPRLREMMGSQGMHLLDVSVGGQSSHHQSQQQFGRNDSAGRDASFAGFFAGDSTEPAAASATPVNSSRLLRPGVDAYA